MHSRSALASLLLVSAVHGHAQSLGAVQGAVIIGRPLDIVVQSDGAMLSRDGRGCAQATVRYGESLVPASEVEVSVVAASEGNGSTAGIRVRVQRPLDEPFVTLGVSVGCGGREGGLHRQWVLLADWSDTSGSASVRAPVSENEQRLESGRPQVRSRVMAGAVPRARAASANRLPADKTGRAAARTGLPLEQRFIWTIDSARLVAPANPVAGTDRLRIDVTDVSEFDVVLARRIAQELGVELPPESASAQAQEPVASEQLKQELERLRAERDGLQRKVAELDRELSSTQSSVSLLSAALVVGAAVLAAGALGWFLVRRRGQRISLTPWWPVQGRAAGGDSEPVGVTEPREQADEVQSVSVPEADTVRAVGQAAAEKTRTAESAESAANALLALWQMVDFLVQLWQAREAVSALRAFIEEHPGLSRAPYLYWYALAEVNGWTDEAESARRAHRQDFGIDVSNTEVEPDPVGLEADVELMQHIVRLWPHPSARDTVLRAIIDGDTVRSTAIRPRRSLAIYDDLLLLWGVLQFVATLGDAGLAHGHKVVAGEARGGPSTPEHGSNEKLAPVSNETVEAAPSFGAQSAQRGDSLALEWEEYWTPPSGPEQRGQR